MELFNLLLSVVSLVLAIASALFAYYTQKQVRTDLFENQRDLLLLTMSENDIRLKTLQFRISLLRSQLVAALSRSPSRETTTIVESLDALSDVVRALRRRDWSQEQVVATKYSEAAAREFRRRTLHEQVISKTIETEAESSLLDAAEAELTALQRSS
jgi:hypothetical protein